jgi:hypothetical protein
MVKKATKLGKTVIVCGLGSLGALGLSAFVSNSELQEILAYAGTFGLTGTAFGSLIQYASGESFSQDDGTIVQNTQRSQAQSNKKKDDVERQDYGRIATLDRKITLHGDINGKEIGFREGMEDLYDQRNPNTRRLYRPTHFFNRWYDFDHRNRTQPELTEKGHYLLVHTNQGLLEKNMSGNDITVKAEGQRQFIDYAAMVLNSLR